jgi:hypothetical protein
MTALFDHVISALLKDERYGEAEGFFAVFRLITSSYLVGVCTGRSAAFSGGSRGLLDADAHSRYSLLVVGYETPRRGARNPADEAR